MQNSPGVFVFQNKVVLYTKDLNQKSKIRTFGEHSHTFVVFVASCWLTLWFMLPGSWDSVVNQWISRNYIDDPKRVQLQQHVGSASDVCTYYCVLSFSGM